MDGDHDEDNLASAGGEFVGFIATDITELPTVFGRPDRLVICDIYVKEFYRSTGLSQNLIERREIWGHQNDCDKLELEVDMGNDHALKLMKNLALSCLVAR
ncbi:GNAT family N-acetyltransferase [Haloquadratum walsbyi]|uniref:GNAT family N-acetyltransferase n=1 Tax=Haloquadratum walsbyi TaxID=293091 RepID=UPI00373FD0CB